MPLQAVGLRQQVPSRIEFPRLEHQTLILSSILGQVHTALMGGKDLPTQGEDEIEIVRIVQASVTQSVISIRDRQFGKRISHWVVDECEANFSLAKLVVHQVCIASRDDPLYRLG
jgi:hypothetical protein